MRRINVVKAFNFCHPDGTIQPFGVGLHEVGTYRRPIWDPDQDKPTGKFDELEIAEHPYVKRHLGKMPSREELLAEAEKLRVQAEAMAKQAAESTEKAEEKGGESKPEAPKLDTGNPVAPNTRAKNGESKPNAKA